MSKIAAQGIRSLQSTDTARNYVVRVRTCRVALLYVTNLSYTENRCTDQILMSRIRIARNPTTHSSESKVAKAHESEPWKTGRSSVYMYHPGGDTSNPPKDAPSALNEVIIPNVNLPKVCSINGVMW